MPPGSMSLALVSRAPHQNQPSWSTLKADPDLSFSLICLSKAPGMEFRRHRKWKLQDAGKTARLTVRLAALPPVGRPLTLTLIDENRATEFKVPTGKAIPDHSSLFFAALLSALLGGLILNLMPCVLPVLSIKLFAFTRQAGGGLREVRLGSAATASGITFSFMLLAVSLVGLKWSGATLGWGIQFQQPLVPGGNGGPDGLVRGELL